MNSDGSSRSGSCDLGVAWLRASHAPQDRQRYDAHLASCDDCRLMARLGADLDPLGDLRAGDEAVVAAAAQIALARLAPADRSLRAGGRRATRGLLILLLWVGASAGAVAAGGRLVHLAATGGHLFDRAAPSRHHAVVHPSPLAGSTREVLPAPVTPSAPPPAPPAPALPRPVALAGPPRLRAQARPAEAFPSLSIPTARALLAEGTAARARGERSAALDLFGQLQRLHSGALEAQVALISSGQLLLDGGDFAGAAAAFRGYRAQVPGGALAEEALDGLARSLAGLRRFDEERRVWRDLVITYPGSAYVPRATQRLRDLSP